MQHLALFGLNLLDLALPPLEILLLFEDKVLDRLELAFFSVDDLKFLIQQIGAFFEPPFLVAQFLAALFHLAVECIASRENLLLGEKLRLHADGVALAVGARDDLVGENSRCLRRIRAMT